MSSRVLQSARTISVLTLGSRVLGLLRDTACATAFGVSGAWSAFLVAFMIPNLFRRLFGEGALSAASIPVLTEKLTREGPEVVDELAGRLIGLLVAILVVLCLVAEVIVAGLWWYYDFESLTLSLTALLLPYMILICTVAFLGGLQNVFRRFALPAIMPIILNLFMIAAAFAARRVVPGDAVRNLDREIFVLVFAVILAGIVQVGIQWLGTRHCGLHLRMRLDARDPSIQRILATMLPMIVGLGAIQINALADTLIAYWFVKGPTGKPLGPGILYFAQRLYQFPLGVFAIALATAIFPTLSQHAARKDFAALGRMFSRGMRIASFEALPCLVGLILVREPLVRALFNYGEFRKFPDADLRVAFTLSMYAIGIWAFAVNQLVLRAFYALQDAKTPLKVAVANIILNLGLNLWLVNTPLQEAGLALATSICAFIQVTVLLVWLNRRVGHIQWAEFTTAIIRIVLAVAVMTAAILAIDHYVAAEMSSRWRLSLLVPTGAAAFFAAAGVFRCRELRELLQS